MKKIIGLIILIGGLYVGYLGIQQFQKSTNSAEVLGIELSANNEGGQMTGIIELVLAVAMFGGGVYLISNRS